MCGSLNQTTMLHKISRHLTEYEHFFSAYYSDGAERIAAKTGLLDFSVLGGKFRKQTEDYLYSNSLNNDYEGRKFNYDLVVICSDLIVPKNIRNKKIVMVQEGMTDPENIFYHIVKRVKLLPRYFGGTAATGLSDSYNFFCVASENYKKLFIQKGVKSEKIIVTGIPNFDNCEEFLKNDFPYKNYSLVCSSDSRETYKYEDRKKFIQKALSLSENKQIIFKLHPNENAERASKEINKYAPGSIIYANGNTEHMIANCDILITKYSSVVYVGLALGKKVYSEFDIEDLKKLMPVQNGGVSAKNIADVCVSLIEKKTIQITEFSSKLKLPDLKVNYQKT
jgi:hypothetical protein